jgi:hypothetical protein
VAPIVKTSPDKVSREIIAAEVKQWFGNSSKAQLRNDQYGEIAARLTRFYWPSDPLELPELFTESHDRCWDFGAAIDAAKSLFDDIPAMVAHWNCPQPTPETRAGLDAIKQLEAALLVALYHLEWPFGGGERLIGQKQPKDWHVYALGIASLIIGEMIKAGNTKPGITRNTVVVKVVHKALVRMGIPYSRTLSHSAIGAYLTRSNEKHGLIL